MHYRMSPYSNSRTPVPVHCGSRLQFKLCATLDVFATLLPDSTHVPTGLRLLVVEIHTCLVIIQLRDSVRLIIHLTIILAISVVGQNLDVSII